MEARKESAQERQEAAGRKPLAAADGRPEGEGEALRKQRKERRGPRREAERSTEEERALLWPPGGPPDAEKALGAHPLVNQLGYAETVA